MHDQYYCKSNTLGVKSNFNFDKNKSKTRKKLTDFAANERISMKKSCFLFEISIEGNLS